MDRWDLLRKLERASKYALEERSKRTAHTVLTRAGRLYRGAYQSRPAFRYNHDLLELRLRARRVMVDMERMLDGNANRHPYVD